MCGAAKGTPDPLRLPVSSYTQRQSCSRERGAPWTQLPIGTDVSTLDQMLSPMKPLRTVSNLRNVSHCGTMLTIQ